MSDALIDGATLPIVTMLAVIGAAIVLAVVLREAGPAPRGAFGPPGPGAYGPPGPGSFGPPGPGAFGSPGTPYPAGAVPAGVAPARPTVAALRDWPGRV